MLRARPNSTGRLLIAVAVAGAIIACDAPPQDGAAPPRASSAIRATGTASSLADTTVARSHAQLDSAGTFLARVHVLHDSALALVSARKSPRSTVLLARAAADTAHALLRRALVVPAPGPAPEPAPVPTPSPTPSAAHPHEPAGFTRVLEHDGSSLSAGLAGWWSAPTPLTRIALTRDTSAPVSPPSVIDTRFPSGMASGIAPVTWRAWAAALSSSSPRYRRLYVSLWLKIPGVRDASGVLAYQNQSVGTKLWYVAYGNTAQDNAAFLVLQGTGSTARMTAMKVVVNVSETDDADGASKAHTQNVDTRPLVTVGAWHHVEVSLDTGTPDHADGAYRIWVDGVKVSESTAQKFLDTRHAFTQGFFMWQWTPVWGGVGGTRTVEDHLLVDHVYLSGAN